MKKILFALLALTSSIAYADYTACWTPPTENTDGTALTDLAGYQIWAIPAANTYGAPMELPVTPETSCVPDQAADCHYSKPTGEMCYFKYWPSPAGDWKLKMRSVNSAGVESADSPEIFFTLVDVDGNGNPDVDDGTVPPVVIPPPDSPPVVVECPEPTVCPPVTGQREMTVSRVGYYTISGPDGVWLVKPDGGTRNVITRDEAYEWISKDGRSGDFIINPPAYRVNWK